MFPFRRDGRFEVADAGIELLRSDRLSRFACHNASAWEGFSRGENTILSESSLLERFSSSFWVK